MGIRAIDLNLREGWKLYAIFGLAKRLDLVYQFLVPDGRTDRKGRPRSRCGRSTCRKGWRTSCGCGSRSAPIASPDAFIFPNARKRNGATKNGFIRTDNYRARVLKKLAADLELRS